MQISGHGKADHLAKLLLGVQETESTGARQAAARPAASKDEVQISARAQELRRIQELVHEPDEVRAQRVEQIRQSLDSGTYNISGRKVGDALLKEVLTESVL